MKKLLTLAVGLGLVFTIANTASALSNPSDFGLGATTGGIIRSRHNLGSTGIHFRADNAGNNTKMGGTSEVCIFCHTPHHGGNTVPLWNKGYNTKSYTMYAETLGGTASAAIPGPGSLACLACHDGANTFDMIVNYPGKSGYGTMATDRGWIFTEDGGTKKDYMTSDRLNIGTDLTNDHPVGLVYTAGLRASLRATDTIISTIPLTNSVLTTGDNSTGSSAAFIKNYWSIGGYVNSIASIGDILRNTRVECTSCHDPHFKNQSWDEVAQAWQGTSDIQHGSEEMDGLFLRRIGGNSLSGVCRTCHNK